MNTLSSFWSAATRLSGSVDFSILDRVDPSDWSVERLAAAGLSRTRALSNGEPQRTAHGVLTIADPRYPERLARVPYAPGVLFYEGNLDLLREPGVAIVGARRCTASGTAVARELGSAVAEAGGVVISGMAYGIDTAAHLAARGRTIAVLGHGLDVSVASNRVRLWQDILQKGGLVLSEFPPAMPPSRRTFPLRNRIIAWLSQATVVVEATQRSGSLHTARAALAAGLEVLAVPGHPHTPTAAGCLALIDQGAEIVRSGQELLRKLALPTRAPPADTLMQALIAGATFQELLEQTGQPAADLVHRLAMLELTGRVERLPGDRYVLSGALP